MKPFTINLIKYDIYTRYDELYGEWSCCSLSVLGLMFLHWHTGYHDSVEYVGVGKLAPKFRWRGIYLKRWRLPIKYYAS